MFFSDYSNYIYFVQFNCPFFHLLLHPVWISFIFELRYTYCFITEFDVDFVLSAVYSIYVKQHKNNKNYQVSFYLLKAHWDKYFTHVSSSQQSCKLSFIIFILYIRKLWLREVKWSVQTEQLVSGTIEI